MFPAKKWMDFFLIFLFVGLSSALAFSSQFRASLMSWISSSQERTLVASMEVNLNVEGLRYKIIKVVTDQGVRVEIYDMSFEEDRAAEFKFDGEQNSEIKISGQKTSLVSKDLDSDGVDEILVPTFQSLLHPVIHIIKYNRQTRAFYLSKAKNLMPAL